MSYRTKASAISIILCTVLLCIATSCKHQTREEKAEKDVAEYNRRYCPTPIVNNVRTDSVTFSRSNHVFTYHCSFCNELDNGILIEQNKEMVTSVLRSTVKGSTSMKIYLEEGYRFRYVCHSNNEPQEVLLDAIF